jgi:hypothetical protein
MKRPFALVLLCAAWVAAAAAAPALGQRGNESPTDLWEQYPLEEAATPARQAASPQREMRVGGDDGTDTPVLVALLLSSAGVGGLAILLASRLRRADEPHGPGEASGARTVARSRRRREDQTREGEDGGRLARRALTEFGRWARAGAPATATAQARARDRRTLGSAPATAAAKARTRDAGTASAIAAT